MSIIREFHNGKIQERRAVARRCPNAGSPCNCTGTCTPITVDLDDPRTDDQIIRAHATGTRWVPPTSSVADSPIALRVVDDTDDVEIIDHDSDPMWSPLFEEVWHAVTYKPGYRLLLLPDQEIPNGRWYFQVEADRVDAITGQPGTGRGGKAYLSPHQTRSELVQVAFGLFKGYEEHEAREFFRYDGRQVYGPHFDVQSLWSIATPEHTEVRP